MKEFVEDAYERTHSGTVLVFSHGLAIRSLVGFIRGDTKAAIIAGTTNM